MAGSNDNQSLTYNVRIEIQEAIKRLQTLSKEAQKAFETKPSNDAMKGFHDSIELAQKNLKNFGKDLESKLLSKRTADSVRNQFVDMFDDDGKLKRAGILSYIEKIKEAADPKELEEFTTQAQRIIDMRVKSLASPKRSGGAVSGAGDLYRIATDMVSATSSAQSNMFKLNDELTKVVASEQKATDGAKSFDETAQQAGRDAENALDGAREGFEGISQSAKEAGKNAEDAIEKINKTPLDVNADLSSMSILELVNYIQQAKDEMKALEKEAKKTPPSDAQNERYNELGLSVERAKSQVSTLKEEFKDMANTAKESEDANNNFADSFKSFSDAFISMSQANGLVGKLKVGIASLGTTSLFAGMEAQQALTMATAGINLVVEVVTRLLSIIQTVFNALKTLASAIINAFKKVFDVIKKVGESIKDNIVKLANKAKSSFANMFSFSGSDMKRTLQMLTKYIFGVRSFFFLYRKLRGAIEKGLENLVQFESASNETNHAITELRTSLLYLKNAWAAAFAPIINVVYPILVSFLDLLASIGNAIARFVGALTGQSTVLQALKVDAGDYADSLKDAAGGASKASKAQEDLNDRLAAFDDLNVLGVDDDKNKTPSGGGGGGGLDDIDPNSMFERVKVKMDDFMRQLREAWLTGDGFELGQTIADAINRGLENAHTWLTGEGRDKIYKIANLIGTTLDGMLSDPNLASNLGQVLADLFSDAMLFINTVITPERMYMIGVRFAQMLNTAIPQILPELGETIGNLFKSAISNAWGFISTADFAEWGVAFGDTINSFMQEMSGDGGKGGKDTLSGWQLLGMSVTEWAKQILNFFIEAIEKVDWKEIGVAIREFLENIDWNSIKESLKKLWEGVWKALGEVFPENQDLLNSVKTIFEGVFDVVSKAAKALTDIDWTPITNAISGLIEKISKADWDKIGGAISDLITVLGEKLPDIVDFISNISSKFGELVDGISEFLASDDFVLTIISIRDELERTATAIENIIGFASSLQGLFDTLRGGGEGDFSFFDALKMFANIGWGSIVSEFGPVINGITAFRTFFNNFDGKIDAFSSFVDSISDKLDELGINFSSVLDVLLSVWGSMSNGFGGLIQDFILGQVNLSAIFSVISGDFDVWSVIKDGFAKFVGELIVKIDDLVERFTGIPNALSGLVSSFRRIFNNIISLINDFFTRVTEGRNELVNILGSMGGISGAAAAFASSGTISFTPIPHLAQGAVLPPNNPFLAVVGDQTSGTNIEAPLDTIRLAVGEELAPYLEQLIEVNRQVISAINNKPVINYRDIGKGYTTYTNEQKMMKGSML